MMTAHLPAAEANRLAALHSYQVLDTRSAVLDDLTRLAASLLGTTAAAVSLTDAERQWYAGSVGLTADSGARDASFCTHVTTAAAPLVVPDASVDPRFAASPLVRADGFRRYAGVPLVDGDGNVLGALAVFDRQPGEVTPAHLDSLAVLARLAVDHLALQRSRAATAAADARLAMATHREEQFLACLSHEVRTPVAIMRGYLEMLEDTTGAHVELLEPIGRSVERLVKLIDHLRFAADGTAGTPGTLTRLNLASVVAASVARHRAAADRTRVELSVTSPDQVPVLGDSAQLSRLADNLITNAIAFSRPGDKVVVRVIAGAHPTIEVRDTGVGIPAGELPHVFDRYFRGRYATEQAVAGVGLGLGIVRTVAESHGGTVTLDSVLAEGTCVRVSLPEPPV